ncbi:hypothetical protein PP713_06195 [Mycobacterium sp. CSUR Q5927]|nr:hypothetical protein [Mycobacterium sp. CSUR Q5927]
MPYRWPYGAVSADAWWYRVCARLAVGAVSEGEREIVFAGLPIGDADSGCGGVHLVDSQRWPARWSIEVSPVAREPVARRGIDAHCGEHLLGCVDNRIVGSHPGGGGLVVSVIDRVDYFGEFRRLGLVFCKDVLDRLVAP